MSRRPSLHPRRLGALAIPLVLLACADDKTKPRVEIIPEMVQSIPYDSFAPNPNTRDGKTLMRPAEHTIPRDYTPIHYGPGNDEAERAGRELVNPIASTPEALARGEQAFGIFCTPCHGKGAQGDGLVAGKFPPPPSLTAPHAKSLPDGRLFHVMTFGQGAMPSHASQVGQEDRWRIVLYLRSIQGLGKGGPS